MTAKREKCPESAPKKPPQEIWVYPWPPTMKYETPGSIRFVPPRGIQPERDAKFVRYVLPAPPSASEEGRLKEAVVKAAQRLIVGGLSDVSTKGIEATIRDEHSYIENRNTVRVIKAVCRLELFRRSTRAKAWGKGER